MVKRTLGKSGLEVSGIGLGCWAIGGPWQFNNGEGDSYAAGWGKIDDTESIRGIHTALDLGINFFDTAANYGAGHSEQVLGKALEGRRDQVVIATKFGFLVDPAEKVVRTDDSVIVDNIRADCENSLRRLNTDYIDVYQLHQGGLDPEVAPAVMDVLESLVDEGKIRWYGWSTDQPERAVIFAEGEHCTSNQFSLNVYFDNEPIREICRTKDLAGINKDPLNKGMLTGKFHSGSTFPEDDIRHGLDFNEERWVERLSLIDELRDVLTSDGRTMAQGALAYIWALDDHMVPIPGFKTVQQVKDNAGAMDFGPLSAEHMTQIDEILDRYGGKKKVY